MSPWNVHRFFFWGGGASRYGAPGFCLPPHPEIPSAATAYQLYRCGPYIYSYGLGDGGQIVKINGGSPCLKPVGRGGERGDRLVAARPVAVGEREVWGVKTERSRSLPPAEPQCGERAGMRSVKKITKSTGGKRQWYVLTKVTSKLCGEAQGETRGRTITVMTNDHWRPAQ